ncbi:TRPM8 channel-associated factor 1-like [Procambarus clarkii]|uniref:TRPM8 channel-associated factor 1-like n=1 Tax=Procambarus clarkii TaxID=6728 RepID=UPI0037429A53
MAGLQGDEEGPEYLVNQSSHTCLTVVKGTTPADAVLAMAKCMGSVKQQWYVRKGQWQWGGDRSYCLVPAGKGRLGLAPSATSKVVWTLDEADRMVVGSLALDVPREQPRTRVLMYAKNSSTNQKWWTLSTLKTCLVGAHHTDPCLPPAIAEVYQRDTHQWLDTHTPEAPDYIISQSTHTFVTVVSGAGPQDAVVGLAPYEGSTRQQWFLKDNCWLWGYDCSLCLVPDLISSSLKLEPWSPNLPAWNMDAEGVMAVGNHAIDVPLQDPRTRITVAPKNGGINQRWWTLSGLKAASRRSIYPFSARDNNTYKQEVARGLINKLSPLSQPVPHARDVDRFPGRVAPTTPRITETLTLNITGLRQRENLRMTVPEDWQATDLYVAAGDVFQVILPDTLTPARASQIFVRVGAQIDCLEPTSNNVSGKMFNRMPVVTEEFDVQPGENCIRSQFGGNLIFMFVEGDKFEIQVEVKNIVKAPRYILGQTDAEQWNKLKELDAPYSILETDRVVLVVPTLSARKISNLDELLRRYDDVIRKLEFVSGFDESDPPPRGKQWLVDDVQITAGSAHAGFPAMFDRQYYDLCCLSTPHDWVTWHELGHNYQQGKWWSNAYGKESTVNLFSLYIQEKLKGEDRLKKENLYLKTATVVDGGLRFEKANVWEKLVFLMEIKHAFPHHGWEMFRQLNITTRALSREEANTLASSTQHQYDYVYKQLSHTVGADLILHYQRWGLTISPQAQEEVQKLRLPKAPADLSAKGKSSQG